MVKVLQYLREHMRVVYFENSSSTLVALIARTRLSEGITLCKLDNIGSLLQTVQKYCLILFPQTAQLPNQDMSGDDETHLGAAQDTNFKP